MNTNAREIKCRLAEAKWPHQAFQSASGALAAILLVWAWALTPRAFAQASSPEPQAAQIGGVVTHVDVQGKAEPLEGIPVNLTATVENGKAQTALSGSDGRYQFTGLSAGKYLLQVSLTGFEPFTATVSVEAGESRTQDHCCPK
jgi:Carboxypeptidase regulatory-like domain